MDSDIASLSIRPSIEKDYVPEEVTILMNENAALRAQIEELQNQVSQSTERSQYSDESNILLMKALSEIREIFSANKTEAQGFDIKNIRLELDEIVKLLRDFKNRTAGEFEVPIHCESYRHQYYTSTYRP